MMEFQSHVVPLLSLLVISGNIFLMVHHTLIDHMKTNSREGSFVLCHMHPHCKSWSITSGAGFTLAELYIMGSKTLLFVHPFAHVVMLVYGLPPIASASRSCLLYSGSGSAPCYMIAC